MKRALLCTLIAAALLLGACSRASESTVRPSRTTATAVSSQEDSKAKIFIAMLLSPKDRRSPPYCCQGTFGPGAALGSKGMRTYLWYLSAENVFS